MEGSGRPTTPIHQANHPSCLASLDEPSSELTEPSSEPRRPQTTSTTFRAAPPSSDHVDHGPRRPRPERLCRAPTTSTTRPHRNDDRREERRYDNRDHRRDDKSESSRTGQLHRHRPDFYPKISTLLIFIFNIIFHYDVSPQTSSS